MDDCRQEQRDGLNNILKDIMDGVNSNGARAGENSTNPRFDAKSEIAPHVYDPDYQAPKDDCLLYLSDEEIGSKGNIIAITGKAKSRKTVISSAILSSFLNPLKQMLGFRAVNVPKIVYLDTEQGRKHFQKCVSRAIVQSGKSYNQISDRFLAINIKSFDLMEKRAVLKWLMTEVKPSVVVIDQVRDLLSNSNDPDQSTELINELERYGDRDGCLIVTVIHTTKSTGHMKGFLGTAIEEKAETVILIEKDEDEPEVSKVSCQYARNLDFKPFTIRYNVELGYYESEYTTEAPKKLKGGDFASMGEAYHLGQLRKLFNTYPKGLGYRELVSALKSMYGLGDNKAKDLCTWVQAEGYVEKKGGYRGDYFLSQKFNYEE